MAQMDQLFAIDTKAREENLNPSYRLFTAASLPLRDFFVCRHPHTPPKNPPSNKWGW
jgi:hypothetical protein